MLVKNHFHFGFHLTPVDLPDHDRRYTKYPSHFSYFRVAGDVDQCGPLIHASTLVVVRGTFESGLHLDPVAGVALDVTVVLAGLVAALLLKVRRWGRVVVHSGRLDGRVDCNAIKDNKTSFLHYYSNIQALLLPGELQ